MELIQTEIILPYVYAAYTIVCIMLMIWACIQIDK